MANGKGLYRWADDTNYDDEWINNKPLYPDRIKAPDGRPIAAQEFKTNLLIYEMNTQIQTENFSKISSLSSDSIFSSEIIETMRSK